MNKEEKKIKDLGIDVPVWIEQDITVGQVEAITQGGCESGAYMAAVRYFDAMQTLAEHGDEILDFIDGTTGDFDAFSFEHCSWNEMNCKIVSHAVELWAIGVDEKLKEGE